MEKERKIPFKNYIFLGIIIVISIFLVYYVYLWYIAYEESKLNTPIMDRYMQVINYNELDSYIMENKDAIVYVSVLENQEIRDFEVDFKKYYSKVNLHSKMLYLNFTDVYNNSELLTSAIDKYDYKTKSIGNIPCIIVFKNGEITDIYDIKANGYNLDNLSLYLEKQGITLND